MLETAVIRYESHRPMHPDLGADRPIDVRHSRAWAEEGRFEERLAPQQELWPEGPDGWLAHALG